MFRKARDCAVTIQNYEAHFLSHTSFVDTTTIMAFDEEKVIQALEDPDRHHGSLLADTKARIIYETQNHGVFSEVQMQAFVDDE